MNALSRCRTTVLLASLVAALTACGGSDDPQDPAEQGSDNASILGTNAATFAEANETGNNTEATSEATSYTLDANGLRISGKFEAGTPSTDYFRFHIGTGTRLDVQAFVDGVKQTQETTQARLTINALVDDGYSTLTGYGKFINAGLPVANRDYVIGISGKAGASYTLELRAAQ
ncbi:hypothetical protein FGE12_19175 [Aggregicoccus sp. 17bor-14]|uniref:hypothetical protein n=1 Tax=Myxococcaceae TaxID=31 RepID=UPI00129CC45A|nr:MULTISPECIES: hypothetical protein [Myxococcaceae]MBF5044529.1 hypothetical protein [Simulacricoccus sp. 17bor-14]MRI90274.1 hypothetical protein [Aggregicoccus sp. 17bor-14]